MARFDIILAGGGLANGLIAARLGRIRPELSVLLIDRGGAIGGNHTWSYHLSDVPAPTGAWLEGLSRFAWGRQEVRFPAFSRELVTGYRTLLPSDLHAAVAACPSVSVRVGARIMDLGPASVTLDGGETIAAACVIDGRGLGTTAGLSLGYQSFVGLEIETQEPHGVAQPVIMDADVPQIGGYRFFYLLPLSPTRLLVEDTYYADDAGLDRAAIEQRIEAYVRSAGWRVASVERSEQGLLPIVLDGGLSSVWPARRNDVPRSGMRAGLFHQTTGYSLPLSAVLADGLAAMPRLTSATVARTVRQMAEESWSRQSFFRLLNRLLFLAAKPAERRSIMQRFYGLDGRLIERFYAGRPLARDMARILVGKPPIPISRAIGFINPSSADARRIGSREASSPGARRPEA